MELWRLASLAGKVELVPEVHAFDGYGMSLPVTIAALRLMLEAHCREYPGSRLTPRRGR